jgi:hypothetical protein
MEELFNASYDHNILGTPEQKGLVMMAAGRMREFIKDDTILKGWHTACIYYLQH